MKFLGFVNGQLLDLAEIYYCFGNNDACLIIDNDGVKKLAIKMPSLIGAYALYQWDWDKVEKCDINKIVTDKVKETYTFFQETFGLLQTNSATPIYKEAQNLIEKSASKDDYHNGQFFDSIEDLSIIHLEKNKNMNIWKVIVDDVLSFTIKNENAAKRLSALIKQDMKNYAKVRWGGLAQWL